MTSLILKLANNIFIILLIIILLYSFACLWAVSADDFNYYFVRLGELLRKFVHWLKRFFNRKEDKPKEKILQKKKKHDKSS